jgi:hypothetical protein
LESAEKIEPLARQQASLLAVRTLTHELERGANAEDGGAYALENDGIFSTASHFEIGGEKRISQTSIRVDQCPEGLFYWARCIKQPLPYGW